MKSKDLDTYRCRKSEEVAKVGLAGKDGLCDSRITLHFHEV